MSDPLYAFPTVCGQTLRALARAATESNLRRYELIARYVGSLLNPARVTAEDFRWLLSQGGEKSQCGWLKDRFGLSWQIVPAGTHAARPDDRHGRERRPHLPHAPHRYRPDGRAGQAAGDPRQHLLGQAGADALDQLLDGFRLVAGRQKRLVQLVGAVGERDDHSVAEERLIDHCSRSEFRGAGPCAA